MRPTFSLLTAVALLAVPLVAGAETLVEVGHNRLEPAAITIKSGDTVTFVNKDQMPGGHTIVADDGTFSSPPPGAALCPSTVAKRLEKELRRRLGDVGVVHRVLGVAASESS